MAGTESRPYPGAYSHEAHGGQTASSMSKHTMDQHIEDEWFFSKQMTMSIGSKNRGDVGHLAAHAAVANVQCKGRTLCPSVGALGPRQPTRARPLRALRV